MIRLIRHIIRAFYYNESHLRNKIENGNYFVALMGGAFFVIVTIALITISFFSLFPSVYESYLRLGKLFNSKVVGVFVVIVTVVVLRVLVPRSEIEKNILEKPEVDRTVNYLLTYIFISIAVVIFLGLKFLRVYKENMGPL